MKATLMLNEKLSTRHPYILRTPQGEDYAVGSETLASNVCKIKGWELTKAF